MEPDASFDAWSEGQAYDLYMGRWSRKIAQGFLDWLDPAGGLDWLDIGCGSGALGETILARCAPASLTGLDPSPAFVETARRRIPDARADFVAGDAQALPFDPGRFDAAASGLVLNFVPDKTAALAEMRRVLRPGGWLAFYVWDYPGGGMGMIDAFWSAVAEAGAGAADLDEARRFPDCTPDGLGALCRASGLSGAEIAALDLTSDFADFEDFWTPFTLGTGPAPGYLRSLPETRQEAVRAALAARFPASGGFSLPARAWAVRARMPA